VSITTPLFTSHSRHWRDNRYVYPVISRRSAGLSIGVNLNPDKICNFDCIYCCVDRTVPPTITEVDMAVLEAELQHMIHLATTGQLFTAPPFDQTPAPLRRINDVAFSGDGEPTSFKEFGAACQLAARLLQQANRPDVKIVVITNATLFQRPSVAAALEFLDKHNGEIWAKLDAGTQDYYALVERTSIPLARVMDNIIAAARTRPIVIQSLFMNVQGQPPPPAEITAFVERLKDIRAAAGQVKLVQVYTVARQAAESYVSPLPRTTVDDITAQVKAAGFEAAAFYGPE
jgi:wyosine [tRNA(Phe)-imidazoG37] synthetase (radical SAM superfamily)